MHNLQSNSLSNDSKLNSHMNHLVHTNAPLKRYIGYQNKLYNDDNNINNHFREVGSPSLVRELLVNEK